MEKLRWRERELLRRFYGPSAEGELERRFLEVIERLVRPGDRLLAVLRKPRADGPDSVDLPKRQAL